MRGLGLAPLLPFVSTFLACSTPAPAPPPPPVDTPAPTVTNVVLITIDTLRADVLGTYGGPAHTPVLDALAARGWRFERCISASMLTNPSHASILTSLWPRDHGVYDNENGVADGVKTIATQLSRHGMRTGAVIGFPHLNPSVANLAQGFDQFAPAPRQERRADETSVAALRSLDDLGTTAPFFFWVHYVDPHAPYEPPSRNAPRPSTFGAPDTLAHAQAVAPGVQRNNPWFREVFKSGGHGRDLVSRYIAEVEAADAGLGVLIDGLRERGLLETTAIVVTSDHGENLGEHDLHFHHGGLYDETVHVPLVVALPRGASPKKEIAGMVSTVDIAPTILELVGAPRWEPMRGWSLVGSAWRGGETRSYAYSEHLLAQLVSVRGEDGTVILHRKNSKMFPSYPFVAGRREVLSQDEAGTGSAENLDSALQQFLDVSSMLSARPAVDQDRDSLRALGYVE